MPVIRLEGCRNDSLLGYLKALGTSRLIAAGLDPNVQCAWDGSTYTIATRVPEDALHGFFLRTYSPTPVLNPWNSGAGFDSKNDAAATTLRRVSQMKHPRWQPYRHALAYIDATFITNGDRAKYLDSDDKHGFIRQLRSRCPEEMLPWLDVAVLLGPDRVAFPYIMGSGGNDGRLDFSVNFTARALDICGDDPIPEAAKLLEDSLHDTAFARLTKDVAIGQFSSRHAGGVNATSGFDADSLVNPWDYALMIEGALLFTGAIGRRTDRAPGRPLFPFALRSVPGGYGTASSEEQVRGEMWLPVWDGHASLRSIADLLRRGRMDVPDEHERSNVRGAALASEAAAAVVTMGVGLGIRSLQRIGFVQRNGLAFSAAALGPVHVEKRYDRGLAILSGNLSSWIDRVGRLELGANAREALRTFNDLLLRFSSVPADYKAHTRQDLLIAVADLDRAIRRTRREAPAFPRLPAEAAEFLDDGTAIHRAAMAVASYGADGRYTDTYEPLQRAGDDSTRTLRDFLEVRIAADAKEPAAGWFRATHFVSSEDAIEFLTFSREERLRFNRLLRAYALIRLAHPRTTNAGESNADVNISASFAVLKIVFDDRQARDDRIVRLLFAQNTTAALALAVRRARTIRALALAPAPRNVATVRLEDPQWTACSLALPLRPSVSNYRRLFTAALTASADPLRDVSLDGYVRDYLAETVSSSQKGQRSE